MIRPAFLILALASFAPRQAAADPPTAHLPMAFEATIEPGDTLDSVLGHSGVLATIRAEAALALSGVYDLTALRPGHRIEWTAASGDPSSLTRLSLFVEDGVEIALTFDGPIAARRLDPPVRETDRRETLTLDGTLYDALMARKHRNALRLTLRHFLRARSISGATSKVERPSRWSGKKISFPMATSRESRA